MARELHRIIAADDSVPLNRSRRVLAFLHRSFVALGAACASNSKAPELGVGYVAAARHRKGIRGRESWVEEGGLERMTC